MLVQGQELIRPQVPEPGERSPKDEGQDEDPVHDQALAARARDHVEIVLLPVEAAHTNKVAGTDHEHDLKENETTPLNSS